MDEIPGGALSNAAARIAEAQRTPITTGYVRKDLDGREGYAAVIEANVHAPRLWRTFEVLVSALLPAVAAPIVGVFREEPVLGDYTTRDAALAALQPYADALTHDGFLEFGCIFQHAGRTDEVFVPSAKFIRIWTNAPDQAEDVLRSEGIPLMPDLRFVDEFPLVREAQPFDGQQSGWYAVVESLRGQFRQLPDPPFDE